ncbi:MAG: FkbM family methyltransferase [Terracidiphilus sp.]
MTNDQVFSGTLFSRYRARIANRLSSSMRKVRTLLGMTIEYRYDKFSIKLPAEHLLPVFRKSDNLYDRFLPHLSRYLMPQSTVIDVGANCGDTLAAMCESNSDLRFICVEPDPLFFRFLQTNVQRLEAIYKETSIVTIRALVGRQIAEASLAGSGGTRRAIIGHRDESILSRSLDDILSHCEAASVSLLKSDVDGFDYDVIDSSDLILRTHMPILYFECQFDCISQKEAFEKTIAGLEEMGYVNWVMFDNFGETVLRTRDILTVYQLFDYVWRQCLGRSTRTIGYFDVLACTAKDSVLIEKVVDDYIVTR